MKHRGMTVVVATCLALLVAGSASALTLYTPPVSGNPSFSCSIVNVGSKTLKTKVELLSYDGVVIPDSDTGSSTLAAGKGRFVATTNIDAAYCRITVTATAFTPTAKMVRGMALVNYGLDTAYAIPAQ